MAKMLYALGKASGKLGGQVLAVRAGQQIVRQRPVEVANPNTPGQVASRSKLKLLSQVGASIESVIAIPKSGLVSSRNKFTSANYRYTTYDGSVADLELANMQLTDSAVGLPGFSVTRSQADGIQIELKESASGQFARVAYVVIQVLDSGALSPFASVVQTTPGENGTFPAVLPFTDAPISVHAYGMRDSSAEASANYGGYQVVDAEGLARLVATRTLKESDYTLSETRGVYMDEGEASIETGGVAVRNPSVTILLASASAGPMGTVTGAGQYAPGASVTVTAAKSETSGNFYAWRSGNETTENTLLSSDSNYTFIMPDHDVTLYTSWAPFMDEG